MPLLKWVGNKDYIVSDFVIKERFNNNLDYYEPFLGGGTILINVLKFDKTNNITRKYFACDMCSDLINFWKILQLDYRLIVDYLKNIHDKIDCEHYYKYRTIFNESKDSIERAALFLYLNKTCYHGVWRINREGKFNVGYGNYTNPIIYTENDLKEISELIQPVSFICGDYYHDLLKNIQNGIIYMDPPYMNMYDKYIPIIFDNNKLINYLKSAPETLHIYLSDNENMLVELGRNNVYYKEVLRYIRKNKFNIKNYDEYSDVTIKIA
ncbi:hypothetical protein WA158_003466 [Blastocystis sp. Blastoise]